MATPVTFPAMNEEQRATFNACYPGVLRDELIGVLLAVLLGSFGAHHFYLRRNALGVVYFLLFWTGIPALLGVIEAFFMPGRVQVFNAEQTALLAMQVMHGMPVSSAMVGCPACGMVQMAGVRYCVQCGRQIAS